MSDERKPAGVSPSHPVPTTSERTLQGVEFDHQPMHNSNADPRSSTYALPSRAVKP